MRPCLQSNSTTCFQSAAGFWVSAVDHLPTSGRDRGSAKPHLHKTFIFISRRLSTYLQTLYLLKYFPAMSWTVPFLKASIISGAVWKDTDPGWKKWHFMQLVAVFNPWQVISWFKPLPHSACQTCDLQAVGHFLQPLDDPCLCQALIHYFAVIAQSCLFSNQRGNLRCPTFIFRVSFAL